MSLNARSLRRLHWVLLVCSAATLLLGAAGECWRATQAGLRVEVFTSPRPAPDEAPLARIARAPLSAQSIAALSESFHQAQSLRFSGLWCHDAAGEVEARVKAETWARVRIAEAVILEGGPLRDGRALKGQGSLPSGCLPIEVDLAAAPRARVFQLRVGRAGQRLALIDPGSLFPESPSQGRITLLNVLRTCRQLSGLGWALLALLLAARIGAGWRGAAWGMAPATTRLAWTRLRRAMITTGRVGRVALPIAIVTFAAALRIEALAGRFGGEAPPSGVRAALPIIAEMRPASWNWAPEPEPYIHGDPAVYIRYARQMRNPYEPRVREPLFVFATKLAFSLCGGRDVAVSIASASFSVLLIGATYLLGTLAFSRLAGALAALGLAMDYDAISWGVEGWRDDAFAFLVVGFAIAILKLYERGTFSWSVLAGIGGGLACLTRITSFTLIVPVLAALLIWPRSRPRRTRLQRAGLALFLSLALVAPFMINLTIVYGDPFYSISEHTVFYRARADISAEGRMSVPRYLMTSFRPWQMIDTAAIGFTDYPFSSKWHLEDWVGGLGATLAALALLGLTLWLFEANGRWLLLIHAAALVPFVLTWEVKAGDPWRLTLHAYPFYLLAAGSLLANLARLVTDSGARARLKEYLRPRRLAWLGIGALMLLALVGCVRYGLYYMRVREAIRGGVNTHIMAGPRDALFFGDGWQESVRLTNWSLRASKGHRMTMRLPLAAGRSYTLGFRMDPFPRETDRTTRVGVRLNGSEVATISLKFNPERTGLHEVLVPLALVRDGRNQLELELRDGPDATFHPESSGVELRYVSVVSRQ
ncbi:MAG: glycosyltransferase family 39 protein [Vicinamibacteria bacterium]|jgi:hypothetical protein|nr:glycosyltransferase family 39 protein [Vicinamibacteria bacterium]